MNNFEQTFAEMKRHNMPTPTARIRIRVANARKLMEEALQHFLKQENRPAEWLPEYDQIADWLTDNEGRGLFLYGNHGRGKSLLCRYVLPAILLSRCQKVVSVFDVQQMNADVDYALSKHIISIDDVGTEEASNKFGNRRMAFAEIMDAAEKQNKLVIVSSNLNLDTLRTTYGERTLERVKSTTKRVLCCGESMRQ